MDYANGLQMVTSFPSQLITDEPKKNILEDLLDKFDQFNFPNNSGQSLEPPEPGSSAADWLAFFWRNFFPFLTWILAMIWVCYIVFYNSRLIGTIVSHIMDRFFFKNGYFHVGSISLATISGKLMFRDLVYINEDYSIRVQDGWLVFRWWLPYLPKDITKEDVSHCETRLLVFLSGLEVHVYNRTKEYRRLEKLFNLPTRLIGDEEDKELESDDSKAKSKKCDNEEEETDGNKTYKWRDLIPVTKVAIDTGRFVFGNHLQPSTLSIIFEEAHITYTSRPAVSLHDLFTHIAKCKAHNFKIILIPSPKYLGVKDEPPRFMGEGFVVFKSNRVDFYYYQDEPGIFREEPEKIELANGDLIEKFTHPAWGLDVKCGKGTDFIYGPWADRQREHLYNFFYPQDYQIMQITPPSKAGDRRLFKSFDFRLNTLADATIDILFSKDKETNALHINAGPGTYLEVTIPWTNTESGYVSHIVGQILHLDATTNLAFRSLAQSETLQFDIKISYPRVWNDHQEWLLELTGSKATVTLIYEHKNFFQSLIEDWAGKLRPDVLKFVPYTWKFSVMLKEFELLTLANDYNWIDCSSSVNGENEQLAICGETFELTFDLPFIEFLPPNFIIKLWIQGEGLDGSLYLPEANNHREICHSLYSNAIIVSRDGSCKRIPVSKMFSSSSSGVNEQTHKWRNVVTQENGWIDCWSAPITAISIQYLYWPIPIKSDKAKECEVTTPDLEEILLQPMRPEPSRKRSFECKPPDFDAATLEPDVITLELEIGPSVLCLYGSLFRMLWNIKENYLGECQKYYDISETNVYSLSNKLNSAKQEEDRSDNVKPFDARLYRPLEVKVSVTLHDIQGHLMKSCKDSDPVCPCLYLERLSFEMHKQYRETQLQLLLTPLVLNSTDVEVRSYDSTRVNNNLKNGFLTLSTLQFRGHAMFSGVGRPLESETLEYGWLVDVQLGEIAGKLTLPQTQHVVTCLETFLLDVIQVDSSLQPPIPYFKCLHDVLQTVCPQSSHNKLCPYPEDLKYRMVRLSIERIDVCLIESNVCIAMQLIPIKLALCNLHSCHTSQGFTLLMNNVSVKQFTLINTPFSSKSYKSSSSTHSQTHSNSQTHLQSTHWLEVSSISLGPMFFDAASHIASQTHTVSQNEFLKIHDMKTKRLWFLYPEDATILPPSLIGKCGCVGGSAFFGRNKRGIDFFNVSSKRKSSDYADYEYELPHRYRKHSHDLEFGESLLHRGDYVLGEKMVINEDEDDDDSLEIIMPHMERSFYSSASLSATIPVPMSFTYNSEETLKNYKEFEPQLAKSSKLKLIGRQFSSPGSERNSSHEIATNNRTHNLSPSSAFSYPVQSLLCPDKNVRDMFKQRSHSFNASETDRDDDQDNILNDLLAEQAKRQQQQERRVEFETCESDSRDFSSLRSRKKSLELESVSSASERYFSAEDLSLRPPSFSSSASSDTLRSDTRMLSVNSTTATTPSEMYVTAKETLSSAYNDPLSSQATSHSIYQSLPSSSNELKDEIAKDQHGSSFHSENVKKKRQRKKSTTESNSISSTSFISAVSSQDDFALVDLHNQMEKSITESPLLMSSYTSHLSHYSCKNWDIPAPLPHLTPPQISNREWFMKKSTQWRPKFRPVSYGFSCLRIVDKPKETTNETNVEIEENFVPGSVYFETNLDKRDDCPSKGNIKKESATNEDKSVEKVIEVKAEKITILIKLKSNIDIKLSPLSLEGLKTFINSITPTLSSLHPLSVINHLNLLCLNEVEKDNKLTKEKTLYLGQLREKAWKAITDKKLDNKKVIQSRTIRANTNTVDETAPTSLIANQFEETKTSKIQAFIRIDQININMMQSSLVEEIISFAALDNMKDLMCVSVLSVCIKDTSLNFSHHLRQKRTLHTFMDQSSNASKLSEKALMSRFFSKKQKKESAEIKCITIETKDAELEESVGNLNVTSLQIQLSRLKNSSSILKEAMLTVIPTQESKVGFTFEKSLYPTVNIKQSTSDGKLKSQKSRPLKGMLQRQETVREGDVRESDDVFINIEPTEDEHLLGFIMFECGIDGIVVKGVKKRLNEEETMAENEKTLKSEKLKEEKDVKNGMERNVDEMEKTLKSSNSSSFISDISGIWFNFAAPPKTPNTRKIDFTRLDWHLLSTAAPSISAWLSAADRFLLSLKLMNTLSEQRINSILACSMTSGLEIPGIHISSRSKNNHLSRQFTSLAQSLQDDPSCQLIYILRRYIKTFENIDEFEANLKQESLPCLRDLKRGILALCRQWKNAIYMPNLVQQSLKLKKSDARHPLRIFLGEREKQVSLETESGDDLENADESTGLLDKDRHLITVNVDVEKIRDKENSDSSVTDPNDAAMNGENDQKKKHSTLPNYLPRSARASIAFPLLSAPFETIGHGVNKAREYFFSPLSQTSGARILKMGQSQDSLKTNEDSDDNLLNVDCLPPGDDLENDREENLYWWMEKQQDYMRNVTSFGTRPSMGPSMAQDFRLNTLTSVQSGDENKSDDNFLSPQGVSFLPVANQIDDVRVIFNPMLTALSIASDEEEEEAGLSFGEFGTKISFCGSIKLFKIDIVESEQQYSRSRSPSYQFTSPKRVPVVNFDPSTPLFTTHNVKNSLELAAFICDGLNIDVDLRKMKEYQKTNAEKRPRKDSDKETSNEEKTNEKSAQETDKQKDQVCSIVIVGPDGLNQITTLANISVYISAITQRVNLPLLRLLHQFTAMYENVKETRLEMKSNRMHSFRDATSALSKTLIKTDIDTDTTNSSSLKADLCISPDVTEKVETHSDSDSDETLVEEVIKDKINQPINIEQHHEQPKCWKTMYYLLDLYETKPETKTVIERNLLHLQSSEPISETKVSIEEDYKGSGKYEQLKEVAIDIEESGSSPTPKQQQQSQTAQQQMKSQHADNANNNVNSQAHRKSLGNIVSGNQLKNFTNALMQREWTPVVIFSVCKINRVDLVAIISGLKLEGELSSFHVSLTHKQKTRGGMPKRWHESSITGQLGQTSISLLEEVPPSQQVVVKMTVGKSQTLLSSQNKKGKDANSALLTIGPVVIDIPQHPIALHGMMTRSTRQLSTTWQEFRSSRQPSRLSRQQADNETMTSSYVGQTSGTNVTQSTPKTIIEDATLKDGVPDGYAGNKQQLINPIVVQFSIILDSFTIGAALLPSLRAQYQTGQVTSNGKSGSKSKFVVDLHHHSLSFNTKVMSSEANLPSSASVQLPSIHVSAEYMEDSKTKSATRSESFAEGIVLRKGSYLNAMADIDSFDHSLTTDLLNHLLLVQKVFMKEVNEVVQKMSGADLKGIEESDGFLFIGQENSRTIEAVRRKRLLLYSLHLRLKGIQITATTPTQNAVRLETGAMELQLSNRVQNMYTKDLNLKTFVKLQVDLNVALGQIIKNAIFEEAEPEFQQLTYFKTRISLRNALQDEMIASSDDKEAVFITLNRPLVYIQPLALDKAVLVWLNYKNAYEYWNEQRANLNTEVLTATQQVIGKIQPMAQIGSQTLGTLFLQLTVDDLGACLPITSLSNPVGGFNQSMKMLDSECKAALVITLENTRISACSSGAIVSKAQFTDLCIRFTDDFETSLDDWKPDPNDLSIMNLCVVSEGTYEICSRTIAPHSGMSDAKWLLNVSWKMEGFDIHVDTSIGKHFSALFKTLTALAGDEDEEDTVDLESVSEPQTRDQSIDLDSSEEIEPPLQIRRGSILKDLTVDTKRRSRIIEKELNEQAKIINDLRQLGARHETIEQEVQRLHELEAAVFNNFRRDVIKKLRRPSVIKQQPQAQQLTLRDKLRSRAFSTSMYSKYDEDNYEPDVTKFVKERPASMRVGKAFSLDIVEDLPDDDAISEESPSDSKPEISSERNTSIDSQHTTGDSSNLSSSSPSKVDDFKAPKIKTVLINPKKQSSLTSEGDESTSSIADKSMTYQSGKPHREALEPNIDFEFDVKIFFNSGKCVLHTKDHLKDQELKAMQKERSFSGGLGDMMMPSPSHFGNKARQSTGRLQTGKMTASGASLKPNTSSSRTKYQQLTTGQAADYTLFLIPGLDIKLHYNSKTIYEETISTNQNPLLQTPSSNLNPSNAPGSAIPLHLNRSAEVVSAAGSSLSNLKKSGTKKAALYAWITLHSIPDETLITPHILDFLEQALEPIPMNAMQTKTPTSTSTPVLEEKDLSTPAQYAAYASFPVDIIVYFHVQPTAVRFSCLPVSRVECLLQLPSVNLVFSSKRSENELAAQQPGSGENTPPRNAKYSQHQHQHKYSTEYNSPSGPSSNISIGGLSMSGCLADFSLYIFHPYGGQKKTNSENSTKNKSSLLDRKDSLNLQVEFVKLNVSRSRKAIFSEKVTTDGKSEIITQSIRFSGTCDIGSASFKYDMRRLTEILAFPKAWYRKAIWKRMFIGEQSMSIFDGLNDEEDDDKDVAGEYSGITSSSEDLEESLKQSTENVPSIKKDALWLDFENTNKRKKVMQANSNMTNQRPKVVGHPWETLAMFAVNLSKLNITMNMGNVMGNASWSTRGLHSQGRISMDSNGHKTFNIGLGLDGSTLDAKGGIVGGSIELSKIMSNFNLKEDRGKEPEHVLAVRLHTLEKRLDYMGTSVLMMRVSDLDVTLRDEWRIDLSREYQTASNNLHPTKRPALIFIHGVLNWDQMQILMSKSTTPDIMKMCLKLEEFFSQQFHSSKRVFSSLQPNKSFNRSSIKGSKNPPPKRTPSMNKGGLDAGVQSGQQLGGQSDSSSFTTEAKHHRHWQRVLRLVSGCHISTLSNALPQLGTILGGTVELNARHISLACFYGINFRSKAWGTFSLRHASILFATESQTIMNETGNEDTHIVQNLSFNLGRNACNKEQQEYNNGALHKNMATVSRISRNVMFPPQFRHMYEWFHYAFHASQIDDVDRFPAVTELDIFGTPITPELSSSPRDRRVSVSPKGGGEFHHNCEVIFAFPSMQLELKTEHLQASITPLANDLKPTVDCTFVSDFDDHIFVAVDAEAYFFLHELITSYIREKDTNFGKTQSPTSERGRKVTDSIEVMQRDWREFVCHTWHLEPTVRLLSWAGKNIEPYGVDYILQRLGFSQARTTIPKWIQRGAMDPLDKILSLVMYRIILSNTLDQSK